MGKDSRDIGQSRVPDPPERMTGQILGGSSPTVAIKYQIMLMITIFVSSIMTVVLTIFISNKFIFDPFHNLRTKIIIDG